MGMSPMIRMPNASASAFKAPHWRKKSHWVKAWKATSSAKALFASLRAFSSRFRRGRGHRFQGSPRAPPSGP